MKYALLKKLINTPYNIIAIESAEPSVVLDSAREYFSVEGKSVYVWKPDTSLYRTDLPHVKILTTQSHQQVLQYIVKNNQNHIYVLTDFNQYINEYEVIETLRQFAKNKQVSCKIILLDKELDVPSRLTKKVLETKSMLKRKQSI